MAANNLLCEKQAPIGSNPPTKQCHAVLGRHLILVWVLKPQLIGHEGVLHVQDVGNAQPAREADLFSSRQGGHDLQAGAAALRVVCSSAVSSMGRRHQQMRPRAIRKNAAQQV